MLMTARAGSRAQHQTFARNDSTGTRRSRVMRYLVHELVVMSGIVMKNDERSGVGRVA
jgi:hypothetical protein